MNTDVDPGMSCEEYTIVFLVGLPTEEIPPRLKKIMDEHLKTCAYHQSSQFVQSMLGTPVTDEIVEAAREIVHKYGG